MTYKGIAKSFIRFLNQHDITIRFARSTTTLNQVLENVEFMRKCSDRLRTRDGAVDPFFSLKTKINLGDYYHTTKTLLHVLV